MIQFFILKLHLGAACHQPPQIWIADSAKREFCTKFGTRCTKLYKMSTKLWSSFLCWNCIWGGLHVTSLPKFELPIAQEGMVYKICDSVYKIGQNKYKIMIYFSFSKSVLGGGRWHVPDKAKRKNATAENVVPGLVNNLFCSAIVVQLFSLNYFHVILKSSVQFGL